MANKIHRGDAIAVAQVTGWTFGGTWEADDVIIVTINGKGVSITSGSTVITTIVDTVFAALNALSASVYPEHAEITWSRSGNDLRGTAETAGKSFTATITTTEAGGGAADLQTIGAATTVTASAGPKHWDTASNWAASGVPASSDVGYIQNSEIAILYGLDQNAVTLTSLDVDMSFSGVIGLPLYDEDGETPYYEYRDTQIKISATTLNVGKGEGPGSGRLKFNVGANACTLNVFDTGARESSDLEALLWKGTHASNAINLYKGSLGIAVFAAEVATVATIRQGYVDNVEGDSFLRCGSGVTLTTLNKSGGETVLNASVTTVTMTAGTLQFNGSGTMTTLNLDGGTVAYNSSGTLTTAKVGDGGILDFSGDMRAKTVTNCTLSRGSTLRDPFGVVTFTNPITLDRCSLEDVTLELGTHVTIQRAAGP